MLIVAQRKNLSSFERVLASAAGVGDGGFLYPVDDEYLQTHALHCINNV